MAPPSKPTSAKPHNATLSLLRRAHSPTTASQIHTEKFLRKPLLLQPSTILKPKPQALDARSRRRDRRNAKLIAQGKRRKKKSKAQPLSAAEKRRLCIYDIPKEERKYSIYMGLHKLWCGYVREILLGWPQDSTVNGSGEVKEKERHAQVEVQQAGAKLASADFHGAQVEVVRSRCLSRVGVKGIVVRDTMFTFEVITERDEVKTLPKEHTVFRFKVPLEDDDTSAAEAESSAIPPRSLVFELHGEQFKHRAPDRANKKFKLHPSEDL